MVIEGADGRRDQFYLGGFYYPSSPSPPLTTVLGREPYPDTNALLFRT